MSTVIRSPQNKSFRLVLVEWEDAWADTTEKPEAVPHEWRAKTVGILAYISPMQVIIAQTMDDDGSWRHLQQIPRKMITRMVEF